MCAEVKDARGGLLRDQGLVGDVVVNRFGLPVLTILHKTVIEQLVRAPELRYNLVCNKWNSSAGSLPGTHTAAPAMSWDCVERHNLSSASPDV